MLEKCIELITAQQAGMKEGNIVYQVGEHLKDIVRTTPVAAELVAADIGQTGMGIADAEKKIKAWADKHRDGRGAAVPNSKADEILRAFYGLPKQGEQPAAFAGQNGADILNPAVSGTTNGTILGRQGLAVNILDFL